MRRTKQGWWAAVTLLGACSGGLKPNAPCGPVSWDQSVEPIVRVYCQGCHANPPNYGAPVPLVTWADTQATSTETPGQPMYQRMAQKVAAGLMPASGPRPNPEETALLLAWADAGAPQGVCPGMDAGLYDAGAPDFDAGLVDTSTADFRATAAGFVDSPDAGIQNNEYRCFGFQVDAGGTVDAIQFAPIVDNARILHHMVLYRVPTGTALPPNYECFGGPTPPGVPEVRASLLYGWAPGGQAYAFPPETGMPLQGGDELVLQLHYHNFTGAPQTDSSGIALWWTPQLRTYQAASVGLGAVGFTLQPGLPLTQVQGVCTVFGLPTLKVFAAFPHMHTYGAQIETVVNSSAGSAPLVSVSPWSFDNQHIYPVDATLIGGESLTTTCSYNTLAAPGPVPYGETTEDEMCFDFVYVYPLTPATLPSLCLH